MEKNKPGEEKKEATARAPVVIGEVVLYREVSYANTAKALICRFGVLIEI